MDECGGDNSECGSTQKLPFEKVSECEPKKRLVFPVLLNNVVSVLIILS
jgi:hypothetical protein